MYEFGEDDYDFIKSLREEGDLVSSKNIKINKEEDNMSEQILRVEVGQYQYLEIDPAQDEAVLLELVEKALKVVQYKDSIINESTVTEEVKPAPKAKATPKPTPKPKVTPKPKPTATTAVRSKPKPKPKAKGGDYPDADLTKLKFAANDVYDLTPVQATGDTTTKYGKLYFFIVDVAGEKYKVAMGREDITELFNNCIADCPDAVLTVGKDDENHWYVLDADGETLI